MPSLLSVHEDPDTCEFGVIILILVLQLATQLFESGVMTVDETVGPVSGSIGQGLGEQLYFAVFCDIAQEPDLSVHVS